MQDDLCVAIYLRKSRADLEAEARGEGETLSKHRRALQKIVDDKNYQLFDIYEEIVSGERILDRPEMQRLLHAVQRQKYHAVLCMDVDRLGRGNMVDQGIIQETFKSSHTLIITPRKIYNLEDELDEEWSEFEAFMARRELKIITRRMQRGRQQSAAEGRSISKKPPYGYKRNSQLALEPDPETAPIVAWIFELACQYGHSVIAQKLTALGIPSPSHKTTWDKSTIRFILNNPVYLGHIVWGRMKHTKDPDKGNGYRKKVQDPNKWIVKEHAHPPLVDLDTYNKYLAMCQTRTPSVRTHRLANPLAGLILCAKCGHKMQRRNTYGGRTMNALFCPNTSCTTKGARFEMVEEQLLSVLQSMLLFTLTKPSMTEAKSDTELLVLERKDKAIQSELKRVVIQQQALHDLVEQGVYNKTTFLERNHELKQRYNLLQKEAKHLLAQKDDLLQHDLSINSSSMQPTLVQVYNEATSPEFKNNLLKQIIDHVIYTREPDWKMTDRFDLDIYLRL